VIGRSPYEVLGIERTASDADIHDAFRKLAKRYHPDRNPGNKLAEALFKEAAAAYAILSHRDRRARFDRDGTVGAESEGSAWAASLYRQLREWLGSSDGWAIFRALRGWAAIGLGLWLLCALGYGATRGLASDVDGVVVNNDTVVVADHFLLWVGALMSERASVWEHTVGRPYGRPQTFIVGPACSRLSSKPLAVGTRVHKAAWEFAYTLDGQAVDSNLPLECGFNEALWLFISLGILTVGILDRMNNRALPEEDPSDGLPSSLLQEHVEAVSMPPHSWGPPAMKFIGRWIAGAVTIALSLFLALIAMQAPAFTGDYTAALLQVSQDARRDVDQREASARRYYTITAETDDQFVVALRSFEPSNAETLELSLDRVHRLQNAYDKITTSPPLLQPLVALGDAAEDEQGYKAAVWRTLLGSYAPHIDFSTGAATYGLAGLLVGSLVAQLLIAIGRWLGSTRRLPHRADAKAK
jgi:hypothetical protein